MTRIYTNPNIIFGLSLLIERFISFLIIPILGRELSAELYGIWVQTAGITMLIANLIILSTPVSLVAFISNKSYEKQIEIIFNLILIFFPLFILLVIVILFNQNLISFFIWGNEKFSILLTPISLWIISEAILEIYIAFLRVREKFNLCSLIYTTKYLFRLIILSTFISNDVKSLMNSFWIIGIGQSFLIFIITLFLFKWFKLNSFSYFKKLFNFGLQISLLSILSYFAHFADRFLIVHKIGIDKLTPYAMAFSVCGCISIIYSALGFTLFPKLASKGNKNENSFKKCFEEGIFVYLILGISAVFFVIFNGSLIIKILTENKIKVDIFIFIGISISILFVGIQQIFQYFQIIKSSLWSTKLGLIISGVLCFVLNSLFLDEYGIAFAGFVFAFGSVLTLIIIMLIDKSILPKINFKLLFKVLTIVILGSLIGNYVDIKTCDFCLIIFHFLLQVISVFILDQISGKHIYNIIYKSIKQ